MIISANGNLIEAEAEALVNTVNCEGFMGKGIALQFKKAFPENFKTYEHACRHGDVRPGKVFIYSTGSLMNPKYIINFPTKRNWRENSRLEYIESGLKSLIEEMRRLGISSVAVPPLGCGLGGLKWVDVRPMIESAFKELPDVRVMLFEPAGAPAAKDMPVNTVRPKLTLARALFIKLMHQYAEMSYRLTLLEIQKLAYFLQEAGEPLKLKYVAHIYGPYAHNLNKVLEILEGHYTRGYGDSQNPDVEIELLPGAVDEADKFLTGSKDSVTRLKNVAGLINGFETPYGMELLASVHWVAKFSVPPATDTEKAVQSIHNWSERKCKMFKAEHIRTAWNRLKEQGWLAESRYPQN